MKSLCALIGLMLLVVLPGRAASPGFEGRLDLRMQDEEGVRVIACAMKPDFLRAEIPADENGKIVSLVDFTRGEIALLLPGQPMYAAMPVRDAVAKLGETRRTWSQTSLRKTTETATLLGQPCVKYFAKDQDGSTELWMAAGFGSPKTALALQSLAHGVIERDLLNQGALPMRIIGKDAGGIVRFRMDVVSLEKKPMADSLFTPPAGYRRLDLGGFLQGGLSALLGTH